MDERNRVVVVGGGIAGLAAAFYLRRSSQTIPLVLVEREQRLGGKLVTEKRNGFVIEGGPDSFLSSKPAALELCRQLGMEEILQGTDERNRRTWVMRRGLLVALPEGLSGLVPARLSPIFRSPLLSTSGKLRLAAERFLPARSETGEESLASFVRRRMGRQTYERLVEPLMAGIYAGDGERLSLEATFPQLRRLELEDGSVIRGIGRRQHGPQPPRSGFLTPVAGMSQIVDRLERELETATVTRGAEVQAVSREGAGFRIRLNGGKRIPAAAVILATPASVSAQLVEGLDPMLAQALAAIPYVSCVTLSLAYRTADLGRPLHGYGYVVPRAEGRPVLACTWTSSKFHHRAPSDGTLIRLFFGRAGQEDMTLRSDEELVRLARNELRDTLGISAEPLFHRIFRWPSGMPQYNLGHADRLAFISQRLCAHPGLFLAGAAFAGVGIPDCISSGLLAADAAVALLRTEPEWFARAE